MEEDLRGFQGAVQKACHVFGVDKLFPEAFISREDVLLSLPTGFGKSLVFQMAPLVHAELSKFNHRFTANPIIIIIVISPLVSLMEDQTIFLPNLNIKAGSIGADKSVNVKIEKGECSIVFSSPESLLGNGRWRNILSSDTYKANLIRINCCG